MDPELLKYTKTFIKLGIAVLVLVIIYLFMSVVAPALIAVLARLPEVFLPFIIAVLLAVLIEPLVVFFEVKLKFNRALATSASLLLVVGAFIYLVSLVVSVVISEITRLFPLLANYSDQVAAQIIDAVSNFQWFYVQLNLPPAAQAAIENNLQKGVDVLSGLMNSTIDGLTQLLLILPGLLVFMIITTVATYFIINDRSVIRTFILSSLPGSFRSQTNNVVTQLFQALTGFAKAYSILITITAIITMVSLKLLGIKYILTIGLLVGLLDIMPVLGPGVVFLPWALYNILVGQTGLGVSLLVIYLVISGVRQVLEPKIVGDNIGLHPLATLISLYVGLQLAGTTGLILGPVLLVILIASHRAGMLERFDWRKKNEV
ncbi:MAG TPA: sporulation integral membrane protein YtvI [Syntrophomonas sp.]|jgi:sporulation integral membrane protein YtvI|nr:sporulation integral membrane protein YtvI [Syntrophomonas sp.]